MAKLEQVGLRHPAVVDALVGVALQLEQQAVVRFPHDEPHAHVDLVAERILVEPGDGSLLTRGEIEYYEDVVRLAANRRGYHFSRGRNGGVDDVVLGVQILEREYRLGTRRRGLRDGIRTGKRATGDQHQQRGGARAPRTWRVHGQAGSLERRGSRIVF